MQKEYINIEKALIPYRFEAELGAELFEIQIEYNGLHDYFTVDLNKDGALLVANEKLVYGEPLFADVYDERFPAPTIVPLDESGKESRITWANLNETVYLVVDNGE